MLAGFSGHLISESFLEQHLETAVPAQRDRHDLVDWRERTQRLGPASSLRSLLEIGAEPLARVLGFSNVVERAFVKDAVAATLVGASAPVALVVTAWGERLDGFWRLGIVQAHERSATWCLLFNGTHVRVMEARRLYARRYAELDLDLAAENERTHAALCALVRAEVLSAGPGGDESSLRALLAASERHASVVCRSLRNGVLDASADILGALASGSPRSRRVPQSLALNTERAQRSTLEATFEQALTIVYRILFLLFAEARGLVPLWHPVYRESYSLETIRAAAERSGKSPGMWDALRAVSRLAHAGCHAGDLRVTPFNGRLFAPSRTPLADRHDLDDEVARRAVLALATRPAADRAGRERIAYRDLGVEQLGAVYETLLDYRPLAVDPNRGSAPGRHPSAAAASETPTPNAPSQARRARRGQVAGRATHVVLEPGSGLRKATGTFYTPQSIADYLVRRTLEPLVQEALPERILLLKVLDPAMGSGAFLVAACRYLSHSYETALVHAGGCHASDFGPCERAIIRRTVAERCLYGVDLNPMAVQLARLSLWLATLSADRPLSFLDHHLLSGDSLIGAWVASLRQMPTVRRTARPATSFPLFEETAVCDAIRQALPVRFTLATGPTDTLDQVRAKERALAGLSRPDTAISKWKRIADLWCARWFAPDAIPASAFGDLSDAVLMERSALPRPAVDRHLEQADAVAADRRFVHWELEFPEVFFSESGERLAAPGFDAVIGNPPWDMIRADAGSPEHRLGARRHVSTFLRFTRDAGVYSAQSDGHANRYQLFLERAVALLRAGGRLGLVLPWGVASDHGSSRLRRMLFSRCAVDAIVGFTNRNRVFPIHRSVRFLLMTASQGEPTTEIACRLGEQDPAVLESEAAGLRTDIPWFPVRVTPALLERISGPDLTLPELRSPVDLQIAERAAALFPPLAGETTWAARFGRELNATEDAGCLKPATRGLPVVEGKHLEPFRIALAEVRWRIAAQEATRLLGARHERPRLAYRDVASSTNRLTLIAAILPPQTVSTHTVFCLRTQLPVRAQELLCGLFNSYVVNFLVRLRVTTHVTTAIVERLPMPGVANGPGACRDIAAASKRLAHRFDSQVFALLNARVAELFRLSDAEFRHVLDSFPLVPATERDAALRAFSSLAR